MNPRSSKNSPKNQGRNLGFIAVIAVFVMLVIALTNSGENAEEVSFSEVTRQIEAGQIEEIIVEGAKVTAVPTDDEAMHLVTYREDPSLSITEYGIDPSEIEVTVKDPAASDNRFFDIFLISFLPIMILVGFFYFMMRQAQGQNNQAMGFGKSKARIYGNEKEKVTFNDIAGAEESKEELQEVVEFLKTPKKFADVGARIPKGVLMIGAPGTGKTMIARAVAGEAGVPFFSISGSEFVEMFVGVG
ncbi:MAG: ATP-dependent metallopeptidase FtsH/Yme1/Tma family protein, partial [Candidatus Saccharimonadales bacterium]